MKILYITKGDHVDYQNDCLLIGLKELYGSDVVDFNKQNHNYDSYKGDISKFWGKGFTVTKVLPDLDVDRTDITSKIKNKYYDFIVYGSIWRCSDHINEILKYYSPNKIICVDGEDETNIHNAYNSGVLYFKRELITKKERLFPISFAFPTGKINFNKNKIKDLAYINPIDTSTYIYNNEKDYYNDYNQARFGITIKKAGWDCMRHYEIMANGSIPFFINIENCPENTMVSFPKQICVKVRKELKTIPANIVYEKYIDELQKHFLENNTTKQLANYFISNIFKK
jgi:hypothetical protein